MFDCATKIGHWDESVDDWLDLINSLLLGHNSVVEGLHLESRKSSLTWHTLGRWLTVKGTVSDRWSGRGYLQGLITLRG